MSRTLPFRPNLEHLKKQAKALLRDLQQRQPEAQLSDAQHAIAREYGFASWPALHAHVERIVDRAEHPFAGTWQWTADSSDAKGSDAYRSVTLQFTVTGEVVTIADITVDASGQDLRNENTLHPDGKTYPQSHGYAIVSRWVSSHVLEAVGTKDGRVEGRVRYEVSEDGRTLTLSTNEQLLRLIRQ